MSLYLTSRFPTCACRDAHSSSPSPSLSLLCLPPSVCFCMVPACLEAICICMGETMDRDGIWHAGTRSKHSISSSKNRCKPSSHPYKKPHWLCQPRLLHLFSFYFGFLFSLAFFFLFCFVFVIFCLRPRMPTSRPARLTLWLRLWWTMARLLYKAGVLFIMLTIKDSISSLILFTAALAARATSCSINTAGRMER